MLGESFWPEIEESGNFILCESWSMSNFNLNQAVYYLSFGIDVYFFLITYLFYAYSVIVWCLSLKANLQQKAIESWKMFLAIPFRFNWVTGRQSAASRYFEMKHTLANYC